MRLSVFAVAGSILLMSSVAAANDRPSTTPAPDPKAIEEMCQTTICQHNVRVVLKKEDGSKFDRTFDVMPGVVQPRWLAILAGQTFQVEADRVEDRLTNFRVVESAVHPERTLTITLRQSDDGGMMLTVKNPFNQALRFSMGIMSLDNERLLKTSSCPVMANGSSFESWPQPLFQVVLASAHFVSNADAACE